MGRELREGVAGEGDHRGMRVARSSPDTAWSLPKYRTGAQTLLHSPGKKRRCPLSARSRRPLHEACHAAARSSTRDATAHYYVQFGSAEPNAADLEKTASGARTPGLRQGQRGNRQWLLSLSLLSYFPRHFGLPPTPIAHHLRALKQIPLVVSPAALTHVCGITAPRPS